MPIHTDTLPTPVYRLPGGIVRVRDLPQSEYGAQLSLESNPSEHPEKSSIRLELHYPDSGRRYFHAIAEPGTTTPQRVLECAVIANHASVGASVHEFGVEQNIDLVGHLIFFAGPAGRPFGQKVSASSPGMDLFVTLLDGQPNHFVQQIRTDVLVQ
jgi:hypothetical protein